MTQRSNDYQVKKLIELIYRKYCNIWLIGGEPGSGVVSAANIFSRPCVQGGLHVFGKRECFSDIKDRHSYFTTRVSEKEVRSHLD